MDTHHRHNKAPRGARFAIAALWAGEVVGVIIVGRTVARQLHDAATCEALRCCVRADAPRNTPSYLYGAARRVWQSWGGQRVITYTLDSEPGDSLRGAGFLAVAKTKSEPKGWGRKERGRVFDNVKDGANLMTDELAAYKGLQGPYKVHSVNHSAGEYVRDYFCHINGIEGAWSLFKRQVIGIHHWISVKHLDAYLGEMCLGEMIPRGCRPEPPDQPSTEER